MHWEALVTVRHGHGGVEVEGWTVDREILVDSRYDLMACGPSDGKEVKDVFGRPGARVGERVGTLKTSNCWWRLVPGSRSKLGNWKLSGHYTSITMWR